MSPLLRRRHRFLVALAAGIVLAYGVLAYYLHEEVKRQALLQFSESQLQIAQQVAGQLKSYVDARSVELRHLAMLTSVEHLDLHVVPSSLQARFAALKKEHVDEVSALDSTGKVIYSTGGLTIGSAYTRSDLSWARDMSNRDTVRLAVDWVPSETPGREGGKPPVVSRLSLATPLYDSSVAGNLPGRDATYAGVLLLTVNLEKLAQRTLLFAPTQTQWRPLSIWAMDGDGTLLVQTEHPDMVSRNIGASTNGCRQCHTSFDYAARMLTIDQGTVDYQVKGQKSKAAAFARLNVENISWVVVVNAPKDEVTGFIQANFLETMALLGMAGILLAFTSFFAYRNAKQETIIGEEAKHLAEKQELVEQLREDITERTRAEESLRKADYQLREQAALVKLGEMAAVVAHEVRNPLAGVRGAIEVIGGRLPAGSAEIPVIRDVLARLDMLNDLTKDLLLFARPPQISLAPVDVTALLKETTSLVSEDPAARNIRFEVEGAMPPVVADAKLLKIVLLNLMLNASQALQNSGTIRTSVGSTEGVCRIMIADNGPGIPVEIRDRIFTPFFTTKSRGTGLGLPTAKRLVDAHHGQIRVDCPPGGGTVVTVELPRT